MTLAPPATLKVIRDGMPAKLAERAQWICWGWEFRDGKPTKPPINPRSGNAASTTDPGTWGTLDEAIESAERRNLPGIGYVFSIDDPFTGIDLDKCRDPETGKIDPWALEIIEKLDSYGEPSPTGTGFHVICEATLPVPSGKRKGSIEIYHAARFFTMTGHGGPDAPPIRPRQRETDELWTKTFGKPEPNLPFQIVERGSAALSDSDVIQRASTASNGADFRRLFFDGDTSAFANDESVADFSLCVRLAFWCGGDKAQIERLMNRSALGERGKWRDRPDYRKLTIDEAVAKQTEHYSAPGATPTTVAASEPNVSPDVASVWETPIPLDDPAGPAFPTSALPGKVGEYVTAISATTQTPPDLAGVMAFGAISAAARGRYAVTIREHDWREPVVGQFVAFMGSGERKTAVVSEITAPVVTWEREQHVRDEGNIQEWASRFRVLKKQLDAAENAASKQREPGEQGPDPATLDLKRSAAARELADHEKKVKEPTRIVAHDITPEKTKEMIVAQGGSLAIVEAEGTFLALLAGRYSDGKGMAPIEVMLTGHAGEPITVDRKTGPSLYIPRGHLTIAVACQPAVAESMGRVNGFRERGGAARILPAFPPSLVGSRSLESPPIPALLREAWATTIRQILEHTPFRPADSGNYLGYSELTLDQDAYKAFQAFRREHEPKLRRDGIMGDFADWGSKLPGAVLRLAGMLHIAIFERPEDVEISADTINRAVKLADYFTEHARIMFRVMSRRSGMRDARTVLEAIDALGSPTTKRDVHRKLADRIAFTHAEDLDGPLQLLEEFGHIRVTRVVGDRGGRPSYVIVQNPLKENTDKTDKTLTEPERLPGSVGFVGVGQHEPEPNGPNRPDAEPVPAAHAARTFASFEQEVAGAAAMPDEEFNRFRTAFLAMERDDPDRFFVKEVIVAANRIRNDRQKGIAA